ncbi:RNA methyltransferase [Frigoriflavimonas asaccharolytica]|uniref:TrmH family RNA methyltransferase n=1 Tax=Frigoriflavimonas asaccharolytica TaxID=2735899 RepID=A0A8J8K917_9FLAO|nr:RNA methyltransferase [Frigoriflavimonas asaccharolytica]NRS93136.1 TrmH family RNA methyltransferase [Frigoriflavimonas asaccharolytica]
MLTAHQIKILQSLDKKKFRQKYNLFLVEGNKNIVEIKNSRYKIKDLFSINPSELSFLNVETTEIVENELKKISFLQNPKDSIAVCEIQDQQKVNNIPIQIFLDGLQDPGNLGTMIRLADWFGIEQIICSEDTVDFHNPKVIQASMGSFTRVNIFYENLENSISSSENPTFGTAMEGENLYNFEFPEKYNIVLGNEGNGIRPEIMKLLNKNISIPRFGKSQSTESLNVSVAASIILGQAFSKK